MENQSGNSNMANHPWSLLKQEDYYFAGRSGPDEYFEWEHKMNEFFNSCGCPDFEKVYIAADQLINQAQLLWSQSTVKKIHCRYSRETTWDEMKNLMRKQYIPRDQYREIRRQFRTLCQGDKTVMEYHQQFNHLRIRLNPGVSQEDVMDQFVYGLSNEIRFHIQRYSCNCLEELAQQAAQIEHEKREPEPLDPSEEVQQNPRYIPISREKVLRTKLLQGGGNVAGIKFTAPKVDDTFHVWTRMNLDDIKPMVRLTQLAVPKQRPPLKPPYQLIIMWIKGIKGVVNISLISKSQSLEISPFDQPFDFLLIMICPRNPPFIYVFDFVQ
ncbi:hypothetical protein Bca101_059174 [Brassica carinata]